MSMSCEQVARAIDPYLDGELDETLSADLMAHLHECRDCSERYLPQVKTVDLLQSLPVAEAPVDLVANVLQGLPESPGAGEPTHIVWGAFGLGIAGALATVAVLWGIGLLSHGLPGTALLEWAALKTVLGVVGALSSGAGKALLYGLALNAGLLVLIGLGYLAWRRRPSPSPVLMAI